MDGRDFHASNPTKIWVDNRFTYSINPFVFALNSAFRIPRFKIWFYDYLISKFNQLGPKLLRKIGKNLFPHLLKYILQNGSNFDLCAPNPLIFD